MPKRLTHTKVLFDLGYRFYEEDGGDTILIDQAFGVDNIEEVLSKSEELYKKARGSSDKQQNADEVEAGKQKNGDKDKKTAGLVAAKDSTRRGRNISEHNKAETQQMFDTPHRAEADDKIVAACCAKDIKFERHVQSLLWDRGLPVELCDQILQLHSAKEASSEELRANGDSDLVAPIASNVTAIQKEPSETKGSINVQRDRTVQDATATNDQPAPELLKSVPVVDGKGRRCRVTVEEEDSDVVDHAEVTEEYVECMGYNEFPPPRPRRPRKRRNGSKAQEQAAAAVSSTTMPGPSPPVRVVQVT